MTILVTGGKGKTAKPLAALLKKNNIPYLVASRSGSGGEHVRFDWADPSTYDAPFEAASSPINAIYLVAPTVPDVFATMKAFIDHARGKGVKRFVLLSATPVEIGGFMYGKVHEYLTQIGVEYGVARPTWFMDNFLEDGVRNHIGEGKLGSAAKDGKIPFVSSDDIAAVVFRLLTDEKPHNTDYTIRGPELLSYDDVAKILSKELGKPIEHQHLSDAELEARLRAVGLGEEEAKLLVGFDAEIAQGSEAHMDDNVFKVTGQHPKTFATFAAENRDTWL